MLDQQNPETHFRMEEFALGDNILTCPVGVEGALGRYLYLPQGDWYYFYTDKLYEGRKEYWIDTNIDNSPIFIKAGSIIPFYPVQQHINEIEITELELNIYLNKNNETIKSQIFEDDFKSYNYENGNYCLRKFSTTFLANRFKIEQIIEGDYETKINSFNIKLHGFTDIKGIEVDNIKTEFIKENDTIIFKSNSSISSITIQF